MFDRVTIVFTVADIDRTATFYRDNFGFEFERIVSEEEGTFLRTKIGTETEFLSFLAIRSRAIRQLLCSACRREDSTT